MLSALACLLLQTTVKGPEATGIPAAEGTEVTLFDGRTLAGWRELGDAVWTVEPGAGGAPFELVGAVGGGSQSFLVSERSFGDFRLELDVKTELPGNSGIQIRSRENDAGRLVGYQVEIDPSERAWSGGLYDEARRGWLQDLAGRDQARAAFQPGEWNHYVIECRGPRIRTWIDGVAITDWLDPLDLEGQLGLQVHSGDDTRVRFRDLRLTDLGRQRWRPADELLMEGRAGWLLAEGAAAPTGTEGGQALLPDQLALRWTWDPAREGAALLLGVSEQSPGLLVVTGETGARVAPQADESQAAWLAGGPEGEPLEPGPHRLAVCRAGPRVQLFLDDAPVWSTDDFTPDAASSAAFGSPLSPDGVQPSRTPPLEVLVRDTP